MGSTTVDGCTTACAVERSFVSAHCAPYKLDVRSLGSTNTGTLDEIGSSSGSNEGVSPDLGLAVTSTNMEATSFNVQAVAIESSSMNSNPDMRGLKKPDKSLPCPRCNSLDTKFCYYNNYNVNQPRHFCKGCQRYWTAGGTLRNVAIGAGRRKRKHSSHESESATEVSSIERHHAQESPGTKRVSNIGGSLGGSSPAIIGTGCSDLAGKSGFLTFDTSPFNMPGNLLKVQGNVSNETLCIKKSLTSPQSSGALHRLRDNREQETVYHEFMHTKHPEDTSVKYVHYNSLHEHADCAVEKPKVETSDAHAQVQRNECSVGSKLVLAMPSERQVSNESGCASSLTTQAVSVDVCINDEKLDATDSEVTKEIKDRDNRLFLGNGSSHPAYDTSCKMAGGGGLTLSGFSPHESGGAATLALALSPWKRPLENPCFGSSWGMLPMPLSWGPSTDSAPLWVPWGPTATAIDAAKAALVPNAGVLWKPQSESRQKLQTLHDTDSSQKSGIETNAPSEMRVWVPKTLNVKDVDEAARSSIWSTLGIGGRQGSLVSEQMKEVFQCQAKEVGIGAVQSQQFANPAALLHSTTFQKSS